MPSKGTLSFGSLLKSLLSLPLWIKQVVYSELKSNLESSAARGTLDLVNKDECLQLYIPQITFLGRKELETKSRKLSPAAYKFLEGADRTNRIIDICIENGWTLESCSKLLLTCLDQELIVPSRSAIINGTAQYLAGRIRLGEYLIKLNKVSIDNLDQALRTQKYIEHSIGETTGLGEVLINLGYITKNDTESILFLKEESMKKYAIEELESSNSFKSSEIIHLATENLELKATIKRFMAENEQLRDQIRKILKIK